MIDPHRAFTDWVIGGAPDDPPRIAAVHASACTDCLAMVEAFDELSRIDIGATSLPAISAAGRTPRLGARRLVRWPAAAVAAVLLVGTVVVALRGGLLPAGSEPSPRSVISEGVLGGAASADAEATATATASASPQPSGSASEAAVDGEPTPAASSIAPPPPPVVATPQPTPAQTAAPTARPTPIPTPAPTAAPTPSPTVVPTPEPTPEPTPVPDDCADGVDNDGDLLIDAADPGCLLDGDEPSA